MKLFRLLLGILIIISIAVPTRSRAQAPLNVILVDCSGSAAETDPQRLAISAVKMTVDLLAPGSVAFVPFCGDELEPGSGRLVDLASTKAREELKTELDRLERGGNTPLADAVKEGLRMLNEADAPPGSALWIFSDGEAAPNNQGQESEIREILPTFNSQEWPIYTIAFAKSEAHFVHFLGEMAETSGGVPHHARDMSEVQGFFLDIYARVTGQSLFTLMDEELQAGGLERSFPIDISATELVVAVFKENPSTRVELLGPDDEPVRRSDANVNTLTGDDHYRLIALTQPEAGKWRLAATGQGRLIVNYLLDSDLSLHLKEPASPRVVPLGQPVTLTAYFTAQGKRALGDESNQARIRAEVTTPQGTILSCHLRDDGDREQHGDEFAKDGLFSCLIHETDEPGLYQVRLELVTTGAHFSREESFIVEPFPTLRLSKSQGPIEVIRGEQTELTGEVLLDGEPFDPHDMEITGQLYAGVGKDVQEVRPTVRGNQVRWKISPPSSGRFTFEALLRGTYRGSKFVARRQIPVEVKFTPLVWQLPVTWDSIFDIRRGKTVRIPLTLMAGERAVDLDSAKVVGMLHGPDGQKRPEVLSGPKVEGPKAIFTIRPRVSGRYTLTVAATSPDETVLLSKRQEVPLDITIEPLTWRDLLPWLMLGGLILVVILAWIALRNFRRCPRPKGFWVDDTGEGQETICNLSALKAKITRWSRLRGRPLLPGHALNLPGMEGVEFWVRPEGLLRVRRGGKGEVILNGTPLGGQWRPVRTGDRLHAGEFGYIYRFEQSVPTAEKGLGLDMSQGQLGDLSPLGSSARGDPDLGLAGFDDSFLDETVPLDWESGDEEVAAVEDLDMVEEWDEQTGEFDL